MNLAERIAWALAEAQIKPAAAARRMHCTPATIYQWLSGETRHIKAEHAFALQDVTGVAARWLATGDGPRRERYAMHSPIGRALRAMEALAPQEQEQIGRMISAYLPRGDDDQDDANAAGPGMG